MDNVDFTHPVRLSALLAIPLLVLIFRRSLVDLPRRQRLLSLFLRSTIVLLLTLAMAGLTLLTPTRQLFVMFLVDQSLSVGTDGGDIAQRFIETATANTAGQEYRLLPFAREPGHAADSATRLGRIGPAESRLPIPRESERVDDPSVGTNLQAAVEAAAAAMPTGVVPRIVLITDGNETLGDVRSAAAVAGIPILPVPLPTRDDPEIQVSRVDAPAQVAQGEPFHVDVTIDSNHDDEVRIEVFMGEHRILASDKAITTGENRFRFPQQVERPTEFTVRISRPELTAPAMAPKTGTATTEPASADTPTASGAFRDTLLDNNSASGLVHTSGKPRVLMIDSQPDTLRNLQWALQEQGILVDVRPPRGLPDSLSDLQIHDLVVLSNVPATDLTSRQIDVIRLWVSELGGGLMMLGGNQSFGLGGYAKSLLADVLPVRCDFEKEQEKPSLAMVLAIDKSGSMGGQKIELAKDAAKAAAEVLGEQDQLGVIAFESVPYWICDIRPMSERALILDRISVIEAAGGTAIHPAMQAAFEALQRTTAKLKHVILLTDGHSAPGDFDEVARSMSSSRMTISTVGIGDADQATLERIANLGNGRYYFTDDPQSIPQIFARETLTASQSAINEEPFLPVAIRSTPVLADIDFDDAPFLLGYVVTQPKPTGEVILATETGDPLLAWWRYGLGMSVAFTSDAKNQWASEWITWDGFGRFWAQVVRHAMRESDSHGFHVEVEQHGRTARIRIDATDDAGEFLNGAETTLTLIDPALTDRTVPLVQSAPGRYQADVSLESRGAWHLQIQQTHGTATPRQQLRGVFVGYPDELRLRPTNHELLASIAEVSGGVYQPDPASVFIPDARTAAIARPLWPWLLMLAISLFVADVALRRIDLSLHVDWFRG